MPIPRMHSANRSILLGVVVLALTALFSAPPAGAQTADEELRDLRVKAEQGDAAAQFILGLTYQVGLGVPQDDVEAVRWFRLAAEQGHAAAQFKLGLMYGEGLGVSQDDVAAVRWFRLAAEQGHARAQFNLGVRKSFGMGIPQNDVEAVRWYRLAAEQGHASAQFNLGVMYANGEGVPQDDGAAVRWYRLAAEQGDAAAQLNLGAQYGRGQGVPQDYTEALRWYRLAAMQGSVTAQSNLGLYYANGTGVLQDDVVAHMWLNLAASRSTGEDREERMNWRDEVAERMTRADLSEAQRLAREWQPDQSAAPAARAANPAGRLPGDGRPSDRGPADRVSTGSGFFVSELGHVLTNAHVVRDCTEVRIPPGDPVLVAARDDSSDLALLQGRSDRSGAVAAFREGRGIRPGADVVVIGYPLRGVVSSEPSVTLGNVSALAGPGDDRRLFQMTAPVQPGNSGGPVLDGAGRVVGVTVSKLDALEILRVTGDIPQNVNFAVSAGTARAFLDAEGVPYETAPSDNLLAADVVAASARSFTVLVECRK